MIDIKSLKNVFSKQSATKLDKKIFQLLKNQKSPMGVFKEIKDHSDTEGVSRFLFNAGLYHTLLLYSLMLLKNKEEVSWHYIIKVFIKHKIYPKEKELISALFHFWLKKNTRYPLFACEEWGNVSPEFEQMKNVFIDKLETMNVSEENKLLDQLAFIQAQDMIEDEEEIINQLIYLNPANQKYKQLKKDLDEKKALLIIQEHKKLQDNSQVIEKEFLKHQEPSINKDWLDHIVKMSQEKPSDAKELALFLYFCGGLKSAIELLESHIDKAKDYWYYLEWTLEANQFSKGLSIVDYLFQNSKDYQFEFVDLLYMKAQFLYGLGKKDTAIQYLRSISQLYPDYKNISYFLSKWSKDV